MLAASSTAVKTAIVCPPTIYGNGRGPGNQRSRQVYLLAEIGLKQGQITQIGKGLAEWDNVHIHDLSDLFVLLVEAALANNKALDSELWGHKGYFLAENGHHVWGEVSKQIAEIAYKQGYIQTKEVKPITVDEAKAANTFELLSGGLNSKGSAKRARKFLGWSPKGTSLKDEIPYIVDQEATLLGLKKGYAETVSGVK